MERISEYQGKDFEKLGEFLKQGIAIEVIYVRQVDGRICSERVSRHLMEKDETKPSPEKVLTKLVGVKWEEDEGVDGEGNIWTRQNTFGMETLYRCYDKNEILMMQFRLESGGGNGGDFAGMCYREAQPVLGYRRIITWVNSTDPVWREAAAEFEARRKR